MRWTPEIEERILDQIEATPDAEILLPDWAYWKGEDQPWIYVDGMPTNLVRVLYERVIRSLPDGAGLAPGEGVNPRNINPHLFVVLPSRHARAKCENGHWYTEDDWIEGVGHRCKTCRAEKLLGTPSIADVNRRKTHCPAGHPLAGDNLVKLKNGRRRCKRCHAATQARYRASKGKH